MGCQYQGTGPRHWPNGGVRGDAEKIVEGRDSAACVAIACEPRAG
jgi:hypothetical protein